MPARSPYVASAPSYTHSGVNYGYPKQGIMQQLLGKISGSGGSGGVSVDGMMNTLNNVQRVLGVIQSSAPIVQQYGPLIKNLPTMYQMLKILNDADLDDEATDDEALSSDDVDEHDEDESVESNSVYVDDLDDEEDKLPNDKHLYKGESVPKLFIPQ